MTFLCDRGMAFEDDFFRESVEYTCQVWDISLIISQISLSTEKYHQDGSVGDTQRGYFEVPETDEEWPKCVTGDEHHK